MSVQYFYEVSSFHMVPHSPFINKTSGINASSPVAIVPDVDTNRTVRTKDASYIGIKNLQPQLTAVENASPLPTGRVPSISPRTPLNNIRQPRGEYGSAELTLTLGYTNSTQCCCYCVR